MRARLLHRSNDARENCQPVPLHTAWRDVVLTRPIDLRRKFAGLDRQQAPHNSTARIGGTA